jgi:hypothetical protein
VTIDVSNRSRSGCEQLDTILAAAVQNSQASPSDSCGMKAALQWGMSTQHSRPQAPPAPVYFVDPATGEVIILDLSTATFAPVSK